MNGVLARLARSTYAATAAEFALVVPLLILFLFGIIDVGRLMWTWNRAEKATQMGVRFAVVTDFVPQNLPTRDFALSDSVPGGDPVPTTVFGGIRCSTATTVGATSCTCSTAPCPGNTASIANTGAFGLIVARMQAMMPEIAAANVTITYENVGLGFAGDPNGSDVAPLVTVRLRNMTFQPAVAALFGTLNLPDFSAALTMEDGSGTVSN